MLASVPCHVQSASERGHGPPLSISFLVLPSFRDPIRNPAYGFLFCIGLSLLVYYLKAV